MATGSFVGFAPPKLKYETLEISGVFINPYSLEHKIGIDLTLKKLSFRAVLAAVTKNNIAWSFLMGF